MNGTMMAEMIQERGPLPPFASLRIGSPEFSAAALGEYQKRTRASAPAFAELERELIPAGDGQEMELEDLRFQVDAPVTDAVPIAGSGQVASDMI